MSRPNLFERLFKRKSRNGRETLKRQQLNRQQSHPLAVAASVEVLEDRTLLDASNPDVTLSVDMTEIGEYWKVPTLTATLSEVSTEDVTVNLSFSGTATEGTDYGAWQQFIVVEAGNLTGTVQIQSIPDGVIEGDETIDVEIDSVINGTEDGDQAVSILLNDDQTPDSNGGPIPDVTLSVDMEEIGEYWKIPTLTATLSEVTTHDVLVNLEFSGSATKGTDYGAWQSHIYVTAGNLTGTVQIQSIPDGVIEGNETIDVEISSVTNGNEDGDQAVSILLNDDQTPDSNGGPIPDVTLSVDMEEIGEYWKISTLTATLSEVTTHDVLVNLEFSGTAIKGTDYGAWDSFIYVTAGNLTGTVQFQTIPDGLMEGDETVVVDITSVANGTEDGVQTVNILINDDDTPDTGSGPTPDVALSVDMTEITENWKVPTLTATLSEVTDSDVLVNLDFSGTATKGTDYGAWQSYILVTAGNLTGTVQIQTIPDSINEGDETIDVEITSVVNGNEDGEQSVEITVEDTFFADPRVMLSADVTSIDEESGTATVTATLNKVAEGDVVVDLELTGTATEDEDYTISILQITIPEGDLTGTTTIDIEAIPDTIVEPDELIGLKILSVTNNADIKNGIQELPLPIINDDFPDVTLSTDVTEINEDESVATITATLDKVSYQDVIVTLGLTGTADTNVDYTTTDTEIIIPAGQLTGTIEIQSTIDTLVEMDETVIVDVTEVTNGTENAPQTVTVTILDDDLPNVTLSSDVTEIDEDGSIATITATLDQTSHEDVTVDLGITGTATDTVDYTISATQIVIPAGQLTGSVEVEVESIPDGDVEPDETVIVDVTGVTNGLEVGTQTVTVTILNDDIPKVTLSTDVTEIDEDESVATITATLDKISYQDVTVNLGFSGTAIIEDDYAPTTIQIVITAGQLTGTIEIESVIDDLIEGTETIQIDVDDVTNGMEDGTQSVSISIPDTPGSSTLNLSSLLAANGGNGTNGFVINGIMQSDFSGDAVSSAGDINGDGFDDYIIGAYGAEDPSVGGAYILFGKATGYTAEFNLSDLLSANGGNGSEGFVINGIDENDNFGGSVSSAGDINGDGFDDIIIGAFRAAPGGTYEAGESYVLFGKASGYSPEFEISSLLPINGGNGTQGFVINGIDENDNSGYSVSSVGDINGDGLDDLIIGARSADPGENDSAGESYILFGKTSGYTAEFNLSDLLSANGGDGSEGFVINGISLGDFSGYSVSSAGDLNGDGFDDIIIGARGADPNGISRAGESYVLFGKASGYPAEFELSSLIAANGGDGTQGFVIKGLDEDDFAGDQVRSAGDINGDGLDDIIIGAYNSDPNGISRAGESYVLFGKASGYSAEFELSNLFTVNGGDGTQGFVIKGLDEDDFLGISVSSARDINGDGFDDLLIGATGGTPNLNTGAGETYLLYGKATGFSAEFTPSSLNGSNGFILNGIDEFDRSGGAVSTAGDINGDGFDDIIIGAQGADQFGQSSSGESYVIFGRDFRNEITQVGTSGNDNQIGTGADETFVAGQGDDTIDAGAGDDVINAGAGNDTILYDPATDTIKVDGGSGEDTLQIDGSGIHLDLTTLNQTEFYQLYENIEVIDLTGSGNNTLTLSAFDLLHLSSTTNTLRVDGNAGDTVIATGGWTYTGSTQINAETYQVYQSGQAILQVHEDIDQSNILVSEFNLSSLLAVNGGDGSSGFVLKGIDNSDRSGNSVSSAGDVNGDGYEDLLIGAYFARPGNNNRAGESYVVFGNASGFPPEVELSSLDGTNGFVINGEDVNDWSGHSVSSAGDINGDGFDDIIIGAPSDVNTLDDVPGKAYVIFGKASGFTASFDLQDLTQNYGGDGSEGFVINGINIDDQTGFSVSSAGDINGDGLDDIIIGAPLADPSVKINAGQSYVIFGKASGFTASFDLQDLTQNYGGDGTEGFVINGIDPGDELGTSVSSAGDINGDGFDDLIIGAVDADPNGKINAGQNYVLFGKASGFTASIDVSSLLATNGGDGSQGFVINGIDGDDFSGNASSSAGDINGDGFDDIIIGAHNASANGNFATGETYILFGKGSGYSASLELSSLMVANGGDGSQGFILNGIDVTDRAGWSVSSAGDINGDGLDDILIGSIYADTNGTPNTGESYVLFGKTAGYSAVIELSSLDGTNGFFINGISESDQFGRSVSSAGDINGDGFDDIIIGAYAAPGDSSSGESYVIYGRDFRNEITQAGTSGNDNQTGTGADETFVAGQGDDTVDAGPGDDIINAGAGNDTILYDPATDTIKVDGGSGEDTLQITGSGIHLDLTTLNQTEFYQLYENIEVIDLTGSGNNTLTLSAFDLLHLSSSTNTLRVNGNTGDVVITTPGTELWIQLGTTVINSKTYHIYRHGQAVLQIHEDIDRSAIPLGLAEFNLSDLLPTNGGDGTEGFVLNGIDEYDFSGLSVNVSGDINGDGFNDLIVGARDGDPNGKNGAGEIYVVFGKATGFSASFDFASLLPENGGDGSEGFVINGIDQGDDAGWSVNSAGDVNDDGFDDIMIGASRADGNSGFAAGEAYVLFGKASGYTAVYELSDLLTANGGDGSEGFVLSGINYTDFTGHTISSAGDINGDGIGDIIIGAYQADLGGESDAGRTYVIFGKTTGFPAEIDLSTLLSANGGDGSVGFVINGIDEEDRSAYSVSTAGDINGDGYDDLIIGADLADPNGVDRAGETYVLFGKASGYTAEFELSNLLLANGGDGSEGFVINGIYPVDLSGRNVSSAGDINGDGLDDLFIAATGSDLNPNFTDRAGQAYIIFGKTSGYSASFDLSSLLEANGGDGTEGFVINGINEDDELGISLSGSGDINGDGFDDIIVGSYWADPNGISNAGAAYVIYGKASGYTATFELSTLLISNGNDGPKGFAINGVHESDQSGASLSIGDINGDGFDDVLIGAYGADPNGIETAGKSYVIFGRDFRHEITQVGTSGNDNHTGTGADETFVAGQGDDTIDAGAGDDVINAGAGNDTIIYDPATDTIKVDGGSGEDTLQIAGSGILLDLVSLNQTEFYQLYENIEVIDLTGSGNNGLVLSALDLLHLSSTTNTLRVDGDASDIVITYPPKEFWAELGTTVINSETYHVYRRGQAILQVHEDIDRSAIVLATVEIELADLQSANGGDGSEGFIINGIDVNDNSGRSVSSAGDINGDGFDDIIIGAFSGDPNGNSASGESYVIFGMESGFSAELDLSTLNGTNGFVINGIDMDDRSGFSVSSAGDMNGDGFDDLLIGAYAAAPNGVNLSGESYVIFGKESGYSASFELSDLLATNGGDGSEGFIINGIEENDQSGYTVNSAGDVNGDGLDDILIGASSATPDGRSAAGESYLIFGKSSGYTASIELSSLDGSNGFVLNGIDNGDGAGFSLKSAGDINGDGYDDFLIGARFGDPNSTSNAGETYLIFGKASGYPASIELSTLLAVNGGDGSAGFVINGFEDHSNSGYSVSSAGDINGDGLDDILIGANAASPNNNGSAGATYVVFGKTSGYTASLELSSLDGTNGFVLNGIASANFSGQSVSSAGDVNGDGFDDLLIGARGANSGAGESYLFFGKSGGYSPTFELSDLMASNGALGTQGIIFLGIDSADSSGWSVSSAGDMNGDGFDDILIGAYNADPDSNNGAGESYVIFGRDFRDEAYFVGGPSDDGVGGDVNNEIIISGQGKDVINGGAGDDIIKAGSGNDIIYYDPATDTIKVDGGSGEDTLLIDDSGIHLDLTTLNQTEFYQLYENIEVIDLTGSGNNTLTLSAFDLLHLSSTTNTLRVDGNAGDAVISAPPTGLWVDQGTTVINSEIYHVYQIGQAILQVHEDIDRTGINLATVEFNLSDLQTANGGDGSQGFILNGIDSGDQAGLSVSSAGDINNDGFDDFIIGTPNGDPNGILNTGESYVLFGKANGFPAQFDLSDLMSANGGDGSEGFIINGIENNDQSGRAVSSAGDLNNDGFDDLMISATFAGSNGAGQVYVFFGKASGYSAEFELSDLLSANGGDGSEGFIINGIDANDATGFSLSSAGDINNDGFDDLIIGAHQADANSNNSSGKSYVFFGKTSGYSAEFDLSDLMSANGGDGSEGFIINGIDELDNSGYSVSSAGDINNDGFDDLIIGAYQADPNGNNLSGESYVIFGKATGYTASINLSSLNGTNGFVINGIDVSDRSGRVVSSAGDINGDGFDDILIGARDADPDGNDSAGETYVLFGKASGYAASFNLSSLLSANGGDGSEGFVIQGIDLFDNIGEALNSAGDINGDGFDDIIIGSRIADPNGVENAGESYILFGKETGYSAEFALSSLIATNGGDGTDGFIINGIEEDDRSGWSVSSAGDINGDGFDDIIVSSIFASFSSNFTGDSYIIFGRDFRNEGINPLVASGRPEGVESSSQLTQEQLQPVLDEAIARWSTVVDVSLFDDIQVTIADLNGQLLGREQDGTIVLDINAAGFGWFVDSTPEEDSEFAYNSDSGEYEAIVDESTGRIDLLSVLMHELGHAIGLDHDDTHENVMNSSLEAGTRSTEFGEIDSFFSDESQLTTVLDA